MLDLVEVSVDGGFLFGGGYLCHIFAFGGEYHEGDPEDGVGAGGEDGEGDVTVDDLELHLGTFGAAYPVALGLFEGVGPVDGVEAVEQALGIGRDAEAPLAHHLLLDGVSAAHREPFAHFVVGQHGTQLGAPVHHRVAEVGDAVVEQGFLLLLLAHGAPLVGGEGEFFGAGDVQPLGTVGLEGLDEGVDGERFLLVVVVVTVEHLYEGPLRPFIVFGFAGAYLTVPVEAEPDFVELFAITVDVLFGGDGGVLSRLYGILFGGQPVGVVAHGVQHVESFESFEAGVNIRGDIPERVAYMQTGSRGVGKHIQHIVFGFVRVFGDVVGVVLFPVFLPLLFDFSEIIFHRFFRFGAVIYPIKRCKSNKKKEMVIKNRRITTISAAFRVWAGRPFGVSRGTRVSFFGGERRRRAENVLFLQLNS